MAADDPVIEVLEGFNDHVQFCRESLKIRDKYGITVPFANPDLQPAQVKLHTAIERAHAKRKPVRIVVLKARQVMISAGTAAEFFRHVPFTAGQRALIVAHEKKASKNIFSYYKQLHDNYKPFRKAIRLPRVDTDAAEAGVISYANGSRIEVSTANNVKTGRSASLRFLHLSEFGFWRDAKTLMTGLMQSVPDDPDTIVVIESTANGKGGEFYNRWMEASDPNVESEWTAVFFAWWEHPQYKRPIPAALKLAFERALSREELQLQETYHLTLEQLNWRRWCIKANCNGSLDTFHQEYPSCAEEAFLSSGRPRFSLTHLARMPKISKPSVGELERQQRGPKSSIVFLEGEDRGALTVFRYPQPNKLYVIGVDVAEGLDPSAEGGGESDPDFSVAIVFDRDTGEQVAKLRGRIEPGPFAEYVAVLAEWFNWAYLVPECNGPGIAFLEGLLREGYPPGLVYHRRPQPDEQFTSEAATKLQYMGWRTNTITRVQLISALDTAIREFAIRLHDANTISEHEAFVIKPNGRAEAMDGSHDDEVIATGLGVVGLKCPPPDPRLMGLARKTPSGQPTGTVRSYGQRRQQDRGEIVKRF